MISSDKHYFRDHLQEIKSGGWRVFARKVRSLGVIVFRTPFRASNFVLFKIKRNLAPIFGPVYSLYQKKIVNTILYACYDLSVSPATYDILPFLYASEIERLRKNCSHIHLLIIIGNENGFRKGDLRAINRTSLPNSDFSVSHLHGRLHNIIIPFFQLLSSIQSVSYFGSRNECMLFLNQSSAVTYPERYHVLAPVAGYGGRIYMMKDLDQYDVKFEAPAYAHTYVESWLKQRSHGKKVVSITLREGIYEGKRNSLLVEWIKFAEEIIKRGFFPVFLRDTEKSPDPPGPTFNNMATFPEASVHVAIRMALYEQAFLNLAVSGGPPMYCACNKNTPYLLFKLITGEGATTEDTFRGMGLEPGTQPPICGPYQKWVWKDDTYDVIMEEFLEMAEKIGTESITSTRAHYAIKVNEKTF